MPGHPQDAGEMTFETPQKVAIDGDKIIGGDGGVVGRWLDALLVGEGGDGAPAVARAIDRAASGDLLVCWSGSPSATAEDPFPDDPAAWTPGAWAALDAALADLEERLGRAGATLLIRPHHRHTVGDVPSVGRLLRTLAERGGAGEAGGGGRVGVLLDVESMLAPSMRARGPDDHRRRIREALAPVVAWEIVYTPAR